MTAAHTLDQAAMEVEEIAFGNDGITIVAKGINRIESSEIIQKLALGILELPLSPKFHVVESSKARSRVNELPSIWTLATESST